MSLIKTGDLKPRRRELARKGSFYRAWRKKEGSSF